MVGRLAFASSAAWGPLARGRLTSLYGLLARGGCPISVDSSVIARADLEWWQSWLLEARIVDVVPRPIDLLFGILHSDAERNGSIGAFCVIDDCSEWCAGRTPEPIASRL